MSAIVWHGDNIRMCRIETYSDTMSSIQVRLVAKPVNLCNLARYATDAC